ncbi:MAG: hypothetical protein WD801_12650 [Gemmatimonadaceae bacterium]
MRRFISVGLALLAAAPLTAQSIASRVSQAADGIVRVQLDSRAGVCGDGRDVIGYRQALFARNFQSIGGRWSVERCVPGPLRVTLTVAHGQVTEVRTQVGGAWPATGARVTDFGVVPPVEASAYFFSLVPQLERSTGRDRLLLPAVLADEAPVIQPLQAIARDDARAHTTRQHAIQWLGLLGDTSARRVLHAIIEDDREAIRIRTHAIFSLAHGGDTPESEFAYLRTLYPRLAGLDLKESVIQGMHQDEGAGGRWLIELALDAGEPLRLRKSALFWAGQRDATPTAELVRAYREARERSLREHGIFVLSQRKDETATAALLRIAREDNDTEMRGKALFWLAQKDDPRVRKLIADLVLR